MATHVVDYTKISEIDDDAVQLFKVMMRLEFALKDLGFTKTGKHDAVSVDWAAYANEKLGEGFYHKIIDSDQASVLLLNPPQIQIRTQNAGLDWRVSSPAKSVQELIGAVCRVRNNLFHGGKSGDPDKDRNIDLYRAALYVIDQMLQHDDVLETVFCGNY